MFDTLQTAKPFVGDGDAESCDAIARLFQKSVKEVSEVGVDDDGDGDGVVDDVQKCQHFRQGTNTAKTWDFVV